MTLDDLLPLLLVAAFVINAVLRGRRASQRGRGAPPRPRRPATPERTSGDAAGRDAGTARPSAGGPSADGGPAQDELSRRLEEARRRVRDAAGPAAPRPEANAGPGGAPTSSGSGAGRASAPTGSPATPTGFLGREGGAPSPSRTTPPKGVLGREGPPPARRAAPPDTPRSAGDAGRRAPGVPSARLPAANVLGLEPEDVVRGVMWSVVLGEPVATRFRRRKVSQRRSP